MAADNSNNAYIKWAGVELQTVWVGEIQPDEKNNTVEVTAGAGRTGVQRKAGLNDRTMRFSVIMDAAVFESYRHVLVAGLEGMLEFGPRGADDGQPRFAGMMVLASVSGPRMSVSKMNIIFELSFEQADEPVATIAGGDTF